MRGTTEADRRLARASLERHEEAACIVSASPAAVFESIDHPQRLSAHMARRSWQLAGTSMLIETDAGEGKTVGSHVRLSGRMLGIDLFVECVIVRRTPGVIKEWETVGTPRLLVIGPYRMGVRMAPHERGSKVIVSIDYALPDPFRYRIVATVLGPAYAKWCVRQMARDIASRFDGRLL
jgi:hypothetical protein